MSCLQLFHHQLHSFLQLLLGFLATEPGVLGGEDFLTIIFEDPETAAFLSQLEKEAIIADLPARAPSMESKTFDLDQIKAMFKNPTFVPFLIIWITHGIGGFGITFVLPTVIYELGISDTAISQLMTMVSTKGHAGTASLPSTDCAHSQHMPLFSSSFSPWDTSPTRSGSARGWLESGSRSGKSSSISFSSR